MEGTDQVLARGVIDCGLAADGCVYLREQRRWHLYPGHAALPAGRREAREIADDAAAEREHRRVAAAASGGEPVEDRAHLVERLVALAVRKNRGAGVAAERRAQR